MSYAEVVQHLAGDAPVARDDVRRWIESGDLLTWSAVYTMTEKAWSRITPEIPIDEQVDFMRRYLLRCVDENPAPGDHLHGGYEAAWELAACMKRWRIIGGKAAAHVRGISLDLEKMYRRAEPAAKNRILCGVLEHAFEDPALRPYFVNWDRDCDLREAYKLALEWGSAHSDVE
jgi:hypothetical protein